VHREKYTHMDRVKFPIAVRPIFEMQLKSKSGTPSQAKVSTQFYSFGFGAFELHLYVSATPAKCRDTCANLENRCSKMQSVEFQIKQTKFASLDTQYVPNTHLRLAMCFTRQRPFDTRVFSSSNTHTHRRARASESNTIEEEEEDGLLHMCETIAIFLERERRHIVLCCCCC